MNFVCFKLYVYVLPTVPYSVDRIHVFDRFVDEFYPLQHPPSTPTAYAHKLVNPFPVIQYSSKE